MPNKSKLPARFFLVVSRSDLGPLVISLGGLVAFDQALAYCNRERDKGATWAAVYHGADPFVMVTPRSDEMPFVSAADAETEADAALAAWSVHTPNKSRKPRRTYRVTLTEYEADGEAVRRLFDCTVRATSPSSAEDLALERHRGEADQADASEIWDATARRWLILDNLQDSFDA